MDKITKETVFANHGKSPRRKCFHNNSEIQKNKTKPTFSVSIPSAKEIFEAQTGLTLGYNPKYGKYFRYVTPDEIKIIEKWEREQGSVIYLRDGLSLSLALDSNLKDNRSGRYTEIGQLEHDGKKNRNKDAIAALAQKVSKTIRRLPFYKDADLICAVPPHPGKDFDLPSRVAAGVSEETQKPDVTSGFSFAGQKSSLKASALPEKWDIWEKSRLSFPNKAAVAGKTVILIDDKYQSGVTIQYVAMILHRAGMREVYGLSFVKTLRDTDNT